ncbi:LAETG motif-containing sortase-dependent surface protein [Streptomyces sp. NPDC005775]|uniref:LAETG motif-containing sortase-dependent surface protein n=1 Tax=Streptomyces sp. NPDC005775 TaxID=3364729 RepID=UPI0036AB2014
MTFRRILATAVAAAVVTPVLLISATPALADDKQPTRTQQTPTRQSSTQGKPSIAQLELAAAAAQAVYDAAVKAETAAREALSALLSDTTPLAVAVKTAQGVAAEAATAKTEADQAVVDAKAALAELSDTATDDERTAAAAAVTAAEGAAVTAGEAKDEADAAVVKAMDARDDERVAAATAVTLAQEATKEALADKTAADEALAKAKEEAAEEDDECVSASEPRLTTIITGLPTTVVAGTKVDFNLRVTNGSDETMDEVLPFAYVHATDRSGLDAIDDLVHLQWSSASSSKWKTVDNKHYMDAISPLKAGAHVDVKMRLTVDASAPAGNGVTFVAGDYVNDDGTCGGNPDLEGYEFLIAAAGSKPVKTDDTTPSTTQPNTSDITTQTGASARPVTGTLAATGSSSATSQLALASGAAVAIGAGAMFAVRRRRTGTHA